MKRAMDASRQTQPVMLLAATGVCLVSGAMAQGLPEQGFAASKMIATVAALFAIAASGTLLVLLKRRRNREGAAEHESDSPVRPGGA